MNIETGDAATVIGKHYSEFEFDHENETASIQAVARCQAQCNNFDCNMDNDANIAADLVLLWLKMVVITLKFMSSSPECGSVCG